MLSRSNPGGIGAVFLVALASCGGGSGGQGGLREACYPNLTCNGTLTCVSNVCVDVSGGSGAGGAGGGTAGQGGGGTSGAGGVGNTGGAAAGTGGVGNTGGAAAGRGGGGNTGGAAAGRGGGGNAGGAAAGTGGVGNTGGAGAGGSSPCASPTRYTQTAISGAVGQTIVGLSSYEEDVRGTLVAGTTPDILDIDLVSTFADFPGDITTGTFHLTADDGQYLTCGICILIHAKSTIDNSTGQIKAQATYLANSGTLTLTSVADKTTGAGTIAGSIANATFRQVTIDPATFLSTVVGSCATSLPSLTFSVASTAAQ